MVLEANAEDLGVENDVAIQFTGLYLESENTTDVIFVIVNKTQLSMTNMEFLLSLGTADEEMLLENHPVLLSEEVFGVLEPNTVMPLYITIDQSKKDILIQLVEDRQEIISLQDFKYQEINSETQDISSVKSRKVHLFEEENQPNLSTTNY